MLINLLQTLSIAIMAKLNREEGQDFVEYAIIMGVVVVAAVGSYIALGGQVAAIIAAVTAAVGGVPGA